MKYMIAYAFENSSNGSAVSVLVKLEREVNILMNEGWKTQGGVSISIAPPYSFPNVHYKVQVAQALIKED